MGRKWILGPVLAGLLAATSPASAGHAALLASGSGQTSPGPLGGPCSYSVAILGQHDGGYMAGPDGWLFTFHAEKTTLGCDPTHPRSLSGVSYRCTWSPSAGMAGTCGYSPTFYLGPAPDQVNHSVGFWLGAPPFSVVSGTVRLVRT